MNSLSVECARCGWRHTETVIESMMPPGMMQAFSDPVELTAILKRQREERLLEAVMLHNSRCLPPQTEASHGG